MKLDSQNPVIFSSPLLINLKNAFLLKKRSFHTKIALFTKVPAILSLRNPKSSQRPVKFTLQVQRIIKTGHDIIKNTIILSKTTVLLSKIRFYYQTAFNQIDVAEQPSTSKQLQATVPVYRTDPIPTEK
jgi:hypothetical protein